MRCQFKIMNTKNVANKLKNPLDRNSSKNSHIGNGSKDLYMLDLQTLICNVLCNKLYVQWPRWCSINKYDSMPSVNLIVVDGIFRMIRAIQANVSQILFQILLQYWLNLD